MIGVFLVHLAVFGAAETSAVTVSPPTFAEMRSMGASYRICFNSAVDRLEPSKEAANVVVEAATVSCQDEKSTFGVSVGSRFNDVNGKKSPAEALRQGSEIANMFADNLRKEALLKIVEKRAAQNGSK